MTTNTQTFKPSWKAYRKYSAVALPAALVAATYIGVATHGGFFGLLISAILGIGIAMLLIYRYMARARVTITKTKVTYRGFFGDKHLPLDDDFSGMLALYRDTSAEGIARTPTMLTLFMYSKRTNRRLRVYGAYYTDEALRKMAELTKSEISEHSLPKVRGLAISSSMRPGTFYSYFGTKELVKSYPQFMSWWERHRGWTIAVSSVIVLAIFLLIGLVIFMVRDSLVSVG